MLYLIAGFAVLAVFLLVVGFFRVIRWELAWDWRILSFGLHAFALGLAIGAVTALIWLSSTGKLCWGR
jgi:hypothetical protein